jgi:hypothetical protein
MNPRIQQIYDTAKDNIGNTRNEPVFSYQGNMGLTAIKAKVRDNYLSFKVIDKEQSEYQCIKVAKFCSIDTRQYQGVRAEGKVSRFAQDGLKDRRLQKVVNHSGNFLVTVNLVQSGGREKRLQESPFSITDSEGVVPLGECCVKDIGQRSGFAVV